MIKLLVLEIEDAKLQENFRRLQNFLNGETPILQGEWKFFEQVFLGAVTNFKLRHGLGFVPKDIIQTSKIGAGNVTFDYANFTKDHIILTTTGPCSFRFFAGRYEERSNF